MFCEAVLGNEETQVVLYIIKYRGKESTGFGSRISNTL